MTEKQELFCNLYIELKSGAEAYRKAYDVKSTTKNETCQNNAYKLLQTNDVITRVEELRVSEQQAHGVDRAFIINGLQEIINDADYTFNLGRKEGISKEDKQAFFRIMQQTKNTDKLRALESLAKMLGLNEPERIDTTITIKPHETKWG